MVSSGFNLANQLLDVVEADFGIRGFGLFEKLFSRY